MKATYCKFVPRPYGPSLANNLQMARHSHDHYRQPHRLLHPLVYNSMRMLWHVLLLYLFLFPEMLRLLWGLLCREEEQTDEASR